MNFEKVKLFPLRYDLCQYSTASACYEKFDKIAKTNLEKYKTAGIIVNIYGITEINQTKFNYKNNIY